MIQYNSDVKQHLMGEERVVFHEKYFTHLQVDPFFFSNKVAELMEVKRRALEELHDQTMEDGELETSVL